MPNELKSLTVFIIAEQFAEYIWNIVKIWDYFERETVGKQLIRAADSISANIAESHGRYHFKDKLRFGYYARGSFEETKCWLRKCSHRKLINKKESDILGSYIDKIGPKLNALINTYKHPVSKESF